ncbi:metal ABC transporter permease [Irregularibacter muris]|uniref:Metal ABC transporter permease n=1 Tax=Irregularibacter muris TaxID=1796619 RepID=A0AAE3HJJ8_9FIRM|nr:metal ABC transporter permease [Irregularibacter muris]MCR1900034.1 metal ABC transporter permease [Irregularibacter muris]
MVEILQYSFMQRAIVSGLIIGVICPMIGVFLVLRRMSMVGDSLSHVALAGVAAAFLTGTTPMAGSLVFTVAAALGIEKLRKSYGEYGEVAIAIILSGGIGLAVVLISLAHNVNIDLMGYLFGSLTTVLPQDLYLIIALGIFICITILYLFKSLFLIAFDEEGAKIAGVAVEKINIFFTILIAFTITISMRVVGILLVSSLMVIPVAAAIQLELSFKKTILYAIAFSLASVILGIIISFYWELAPGGTIVLLSVFILIMVLLFRSIKRRLQRKHSEA